jgi:glycosyltransferase involved in cell wall biosynthesis
MRPVPVVHIITKLELGGAQENTLYTVTHLDRRRFRPYLVTNPEGILAPAALTLKGVKTFFISELVREINPLKDLQALFKIKGILGQIKESDSPMIVHTHSSKAGILGRWGGRLAGADVIIHTIHGFGFHDFQSLLVRRFLIFLEKVTALITDMFIAVSQANIKKGITEGIFPREKTALIRSGIDLEEFSRIKGKRQEKKKILGFEPGLPLVTMVGCLKPQKAPLDYAEVAHLVLQKREAHFILVGDGELRKKVEMKAIQLDLGNRFKLLGWRLDIPAILAATDIFCLTSLWEGLPRVLPQAMALGIPIVATAVDGTPEAVIHKANGFVTKPRDTKAMAERIVYLLDHPQEADMMGKYGKKMVGEFDIRLMIRKQEDLYLKLLRKKGKGVL